MTRADDTMKPPGRAAQSQVAALLREASDAHGWRGRSLAAALAHISTADGPVTPADLSALAEALEEHVCGLADAVEAAHTALTSAEAGQPAARDPAERVESTRRLARAALAMHREAKAAMPAEAVQ